MRFYSAYDVFSDIIRVHGLFKNNIHATIQGQLGVLRTSIELIPGKWAEMVTNYKKELTKKLKYQ